jgi:glutathione synthase/RimK-type ligase-like ATP-grasp enzyme
VRWSLDKHYLQDLAAQNIPIVPTAFVEPGRPVALPDWSGEIVVKPAIGAGAKDAARHASSSAVARHAEQLAAQGRSAIVQPYLASVETNGETGLVYFNGRFSHAFEKAALLETGVARPSVELFAAEATTPRMASDDELALGSSVLATIDADLLYARVDMLPDSKGAPVVLEVELAEPSFFLHTHDGAADAFARAVQERL